MRHSPFAILNSSFPFFLNSQFLLLNSAAGATAGAAVWFSRGWLDFIDDRAAGVVRVAMLPPIWQLAASIVFGALFIAALVALVDRRRPEGHRTSGAAMPLFALGLLALPYLPWIPDKVPILTVLAGPARFLIWGVVATQVGWAAATRVAPSSTPGVRASRGPSGALVFAAGLAVFVASGSYVTQSPVFPGGDEPHYLIIAQSLWRDGDLKIENNHARRDYAEYFNTELAPHYLTRGADNAIYSIHPVGLPVAIAPIYAAGGYRAVVLVLALAAALAGMLMWRWAARLTGSVSAATFAWSAVCLAAPYVFNSFTVYPEIFAALAVMVTLVPDTEEGSLGAWLGRGLAIGTLPWLSTKYLPMSIALLAVLLWRVWRGTPDGPAQPSRRGLRAAVLTGPYVVSVAAWLLFFYWIWGSPWPSAPYGGYAQTRVAHLRVGAPGLLFDQEYGVLPYAPVLAIGLVGLLLMWRRGGASRILAVELSAVAGALLASVGAFRIWWGGSAAPGRPVASGLLLLGVPIAWTYRHHLQGLYWRAVAHLLLMVTVGVTVFLVTVNQGFLVANSREGVSNFLQWLSPGWRLWAVVPSFIYHGPIIASLMALTWTLAVSIALWAGARVLHTRTPGTMALQIMLGAASLIAATSLAVTSAFGSALQPNINLASRARTRALDDFDASARPVAIRYTPFESIAPADVPPLFVFSASPSIERPDQPLPLMYKARFALPAGVYTVLLRPTHPPARPTAGSLALQIGRTGPPLETWPVNFGNPDAGDTQSGWRETFTLPIDVNFVGFRATKALEEAGLELEVRPVSVRNQGERAGAPEVLAARKYGTATVYFHDENSWPEDPGFWTKGQATSRLTVVASDGRPPVLRLRTGGSENSIVIQADDVVERVVLQPDARREVPLKAKAGKSPSAIRIAISASQGFVPASVEPKSADTRLLGCWVEVG